MTSRTSSNPGRRERRENADELIEILVRSEPPDVDRASGPSPRQSQRSQPRCSARAAPGGGRSGRSPRRRPRLGRRGRRNRSISPAANTRRLSRPRRPGSSPMRHLGLPEQSRPSGVGTVSCGKCLGDDVVDEDDLLRRTRDPGRSCRRSGRSASRAAGRTSRGWHAACPQRRAVPVRRGRQAGRRPAGDDRSFAFGSAARTGGASKNSV